MRSLRGGRLVLGLGHVSAPAIRKPCKLVVACACEARTGSLMSAAQQQQRLDPAREACRGLAVVAWCIRNGEAGRM